MHAPTTRRGRIRGALALAALAAGCASPGLVSIWYPSPTAARDEGGYIALLRKDASVRHVDAAGVQRLQEVVEKLQAVSAVKAKLALADADTPNAFAFEFRGSPHIGVSLPMLDLLGHDADALATTVGHELAHLRLGHNAAREHRMSIANAAVQGMGALLTAAGVPFVSVAAGLGMSAAHAAYSREEERDADRLGLAWAVAAGFDACGAYRTMKAFEQARGRAPGVPFLMMHPQVQERLAQADGAARAMTGHPCPRDAESVMAAVGAATR